MEQETADTIAEEVVNDQETSSDSSTSAEVVEPDSIPYSQSLETGLACVVFALGCIFGLILSGQIFRRI